MDFSTKGLTSNSYGQFEPGVALADLVTDALVNTGKVSVVDRSHLDSTLSEHHLGASGEVDPTSAVSAGRLVGARYLIQGNVLQLDATGRSGGGAGFLPGIAGAVAGSVHSTRTTLKVSVKVIDALTGQIVQSFNDEKTENATSIGGGGWSGTVAGGYSNSSFTSSSMGHLINDEALAIAAQIDPSKFVSGPPPVKLSGHVLTLDGTNVIVNVGSAKGATIGMYFDVVKVSQIRDPDSGKMLTVNETIGRIEIMSVSTDTSVGRLVSGKAAAGAAVTSE
jgi:curli biogenesis system outer membrane secretion channel CsgG